MIGEEDSFFTYEYPAHYKILPAINNWGTCQKRIKDGQKVPEGFRYTSDGNAEWMTAAELRVWIDANWNKIGIL
jgi:hypothetical protein